MRFYISCFKKTVTGKKRVYIDADNLKEASDIFFGLNDHILYDDIDFILDQYEFTSKYETSIINTFKNYKEVK